MQRTLQYQTATASGLLVTGPCCLAGIWCHATAAATIKIHDSTTNDTPIFEFQFASAGHNGVSFPAPVNFHHGCYIEISAGTGTHAVLFA